MSRKTTRLHPVSRAGSSFDPKVDISLMPRVPRPMSLICGACGASGRYNVGTVVVDTQIAKSPAESGVDRAVGFTAYFRCKQCCAGGPWELSDEARLRIMALATLYMAGAVDIPLFLGVAATFDGHRIRYATEGEAHLQQLIEREPERGFLWVRLGNLYSHTNAPELAEQAYLRAIELDPKDIEAHGMVGQLLVETGRPLEAVPHWHALLKHVREARGVRRELRRDLVRAAIDSLLEAHARSNGAFELFPSTGPSDLPERSKSEPVILELREFNLRSEVDLDELCGMFLDPPRRRWIDLLGSPKRRAHAEEDFPGPAVLHRTSPPIGRNDPCSCGSGRKFKKCCGR